MKKIVILVIAISLALGAAIVWAADVSNYTFTDANSAGVLTSLTFKASQNVAVDAMSVANEYSAASKHVNGDKFYGVASNSVMMYWQTGTTDANLAAAITAVAGKTTVTNSGSFGGWTSL